ncbi:bifunctional hydroxymethylpyrimidine kinase/phosphomethylpyrimidine kinase [Halococcus qingdaonensis]|uniref:bifunctional hydroxymethylpyrimidine kinase/phosphomethylpyrimidine kinase n=1 Tax=Halococcus qingdaonensis TaxID=224402 RepID=UPI002115F059|nr:bifunctional hydroxymethylpyrimidine kinase/phosphomethylpyrimidine kinase [Halococcus qingdaonensis]
MTERDIALTVAGSDSGGGAGIQADLKTIEAHGVFGTSALTSVTAQNTRGVEAIEDVPTETIAAQIDAVTDDFAVSAAKTGMLSSAAIIETVADSLADHEFPLVVDPVMVAQSGDRLLAAEAETVLKEQLLPQATLVTPNLPEAAVLTGMEIEDEEDMRAAAAAIAADGPDAVLVTGGHLHEDELVDVLAADGETHTFRKARRDTDDTHGSGCTISAAIAAELAGGATMPAAVEHAERFIDRAVSYGLAVGSGDGPVNHLAGLYDDAARADALDDVRALVETLERSDIDALVPEVGLNVAVATPYAMDADDVAAVDGRLHRTADGVAAAGCPRLGVSDHVAQSLLTARDHDHSVVAAATIRLDDTVAEAVTDQFDAVEVDRTRSDGESVAESRDESAAWAVERAMNDRETVPDAVFDRGAVGEETICRLFAPSPAVLEERLLALADAI